MIQFPVQGNAGKSFGTFLIRTTLSSKPQRICISDPTAYYLLLLFSNFKFQVSCSVAALMILPENFQLGNIMNRCLVREVLNRKSRTIQTSWRIDEVDTSILLYRSRHLTGQRLDNDWSAAGNPVVMHDLDEKTALVSASLILCFSKAFKHYESLRCSLWPCPLRRALEQHVFSIA